jgi:signal transduction histidine kinase
MGVAEVSPGVEQRQSNPGQGPPPHIRPSIAVPERSSGPIAGARSLLSGFGTFSLLFGIVLLAVTVSIVWFDHSLSQRRVEEAQHDAAEALTLLRTQVALNIEWLGTLRALFTAPEPRERSVFETLVLQQGNVDSAGTRGVERVWVLDTAGVLMHEATLDARVRGQPLDPRAVEASRLPPRAERARVKVIGNAVETRRLIVARPLFLEGKVVAIAAAMVNPMAYLVRGGHGDDARDGIALFSPPDTIKVVGDITREPDPIRARDSVAMHGSDLLVVEVTHEAGSDSTAPLTLAAITLGFLGFVLVRERRQGARVAERSAELERLSSELLRANRMKSEFLANVSHELRTPLNAIVGFVELLRDGVYGELSPRQAQPVERIAASATHLRGLVDQVLDIAKMAAGRLEVHPETIVLRPFVLNVMSELESLIAEKGLSLSISVGASLPRVRTDPAHLRSILVNLIGNAIKYTRSGGIVVRARLVGAPRAAMHTPPDRPAGERTLMEESALAASAPSREQPWIALQVIDTGIGIAPEDRERIFDEFEQVNAGPRGESMMRGTGLGLAITRRLARLLGGDVRVDSEVGKGSTFTLWMPVSVSELGPKG